MSEPSGLLRSERMCMVQLIVQHDAAQHTVEELGALGSLEEAARELCLASRAAVCRRGNPLSIPALEEGVGHVPWRRCRFLIRLAGVS